MLGQGHLIWRGGDGRRKKKKETYTDKWLVGITTPVRVLSSYKKLLTNPSIW